MMPTTATSDEEGTDVLGDLEDDGHDEEEVPARVATRAAPRKKVIQSRTHRQYTATVKPRGRKGKTVPKEGSVRFGIIYYLFFLHFLQLIFPFPSPFLSFRFNYVFYNFFTPRLYKLLCIAS